MITTRRGFLVGAAGAGIGSLLSNSSLAADAAEEHSVLTRPLIGFGVYDPRFSKTYSQTIRAVIIDPDGRHRSIEIGHELLNSNPSREHSQFSGWSPDQRYASINLSGQSDSQSSGALGDTFIIDVGNVRSSKVVWCSVNSIQTASGRVGAFFWPRSDYVGFVTYRPVGNGLRTYFARARSDDPSSANEVFHYTHDSELSQDGQYLASARPYPDPGPYRGTVQIQITPSAALDHGGDYADQESFFISRVTTSPNSAGVQWSRADNQRLTYLEIATPTAMPALVVVTNPTERDARKRSYLPITDIPLRYLPTFDDDPTPHGTEVWGWWPDGRSGFISMPRVTGPTKRNRDIQKISVEDPNKREWITHSAEKTDAEVINYYADLSPDGKEVVYVSHRIVKGRRTRNLYVTSIGSGIERQLTHYEDGIVAVDRPCWRSIYSDRAPKKWPESPNCS